MKINPLNYSFLSFFSRNESIVINKGSRSPITAFLLLLTAVVFLGCENPGSIGEGIGSGGEEIDATTVDVSNYTVLNENTYSGRLANTSLGYLQDPAYGTVKSVALLKPDISRGQVDTLQHGDKIYLRLIFSSGVYGDENSVSSFEIFEAGEIWRGTQLRYNNEISVNESVKVAEFQIADEDTVKVELSREWTDRFIDFYNEEASNRDSLYIQNFPGLAIVPSNNNQKIRFLKHAPDEEDDLVTGLLVESSAENSEEEEDGNGDENGNGNDNDNDENGDENGDEENGEEEDGFERMRLRDWGASYVRFDIPESSENIVLHNNETVLKIETDIPTDELRRKNIVNAQLILSKDTTPAESYPNIARPRTDLVRINVFNNEPADIMAEIFTSDPRFFDTLDEDEEIFKIDITDHVLDNVYGEAESRPLYLTIQSVNGILYSADFYGSEGPDNYKPRIVITSVE